MPIKILIALFVVILTAPHAVYAASINNEEQAVEPQSVAEAQAEEAKAPEPPQKVKEKPVDWKSNPNNCDTERQYILKETLKCKDKPKQVAKPKTARQQSGNCESYRKLASQYSWNVDVALRVMRAESGCNPSAVGDQRVIGGIYAPSCGLAQIRTLAGRPSCEALKDPATNIAWAHRLYSASGWQPWTVCTKGIVSCY